MFATSSAHTSTNRSSAEHAAITPSLSKNTYDRSTEANPHWLQLATSAQTKSLVVGNDDAYERQADVAAEQVLRGESASVGPLGTIQQSTQFDTASLNSVGARIAAAQASGGESLPAATRSQFESGFGGDLGGVRLHTDHQAAELANTLQAHAFTVGEDIFFGAQQFNEHSDGGQRLLAHEVAHTRQQSQTSGQSSSHSSSRSSSQNSNPGSNSMNSNDGAAAGPMVAQRSSWKGPSTSPNSCSGWTCAATADCAKPDDKAAASATASTSWSLTVMLDLDVKSAADVSSPSEVGHALVEFNESNGDKYSYGFYPNKSATPDPIFRPKVPGCTAHPDTTHLSCMDMQIKYTLAETEYKKALSTAQAWCLGSPDYNVISNNCTTFVTRVAADAGKTLPASRGTVGTGTFSVSADNPNTMFDGFISQADAATWRTRATGDFTGSYDSAGSKTPFKNFELATDDKYAVGAKYTYVGSSGDDVDGTLSGRMIFLVDGATKAVDPTISFSWTEPSGVGRGLWHVFTTGDINGTWGRGSAETGGGRWELTKKP